MRDYLNGIGNKLYSKTNLPNGHFEHKYILFEMNPQPGGYNMDQWVLNGKVYQIKARHTQYKASWTSDYIKHDMALASMNKTLKPSTISEPNPFVRASHHGQNNQWIESTYDSKLLDGTVVEIKHVNYHRYNLQSTFNNHYSYFEIK